MTAHGQDIGDARDPLVAGNPLRIDSVARTASLGIVDLTAAQALSYALFPMEGDAPVSTPSLVARLGTGVEVVDPAAGAFSISLTGSMTSLWSGRDWQVCRLVDSTGQRFDLFDGLIVSTRGLTF